MKPLIAGSVAALLVAIFMVPQFLNLHPVGDRDIENADATKTPERPAAFVEFLKKRIDNKNFDCSDLGHLDRHVCLIFQTSMGIEPDIASARFKTYFAVETMNIVSNLVSSARYSLIKRLQGDQFQRPGSDAEQCLDVGYGICGNHAATATAILERVGITTRAVQFFYGTQSKRASHIAIEANIDGWRYFDTTWGAFWFHDVEDPIASIISVEEIMKPRKHFAAYNKAQSWSIKSNYSQNIFEYIELNPSIVYGYDNGTVSIINPSPKLGELDLSHIPGFIGDNIDDGKFEGVSFKFRPVDGEATFLLNARAIAGCASNDNKICINSQCELIKNDQKHYEITFKDASHIFIDSGQDNLCYFVFDNISIR